MSNIQEEPQVAKSIKMIKSMYVYVYGCFIYFHTIFDKNYRIFTTSAVLYFSCCYALNFWAAHLIISLISSPLKTLLKMAWPIVC